MKEKLQRLLENIALRRKKSEEYIKASAKGKALIQKEVNILLRRIESMVTDIKEAGKGSILTVTYMTPNFEIPGHNDVYEETFIGLDLEDIHNLFQVRSFITGVDYKILEILKQNTYVKKSHTI